MPAYLVKGADNADALRNHRGKSGAGCPQMKPSYQQKIQGNVKHTGNKDEKERASGITDATKNAADDIIGDNQRNSHETDAQIGSCLCHSFRGCRKQKKNAIDGKQKKDGEKQGEQRKKNDGIADGLTDLFLLFFSYGLTDQYRGAHGKTDDHHGEHVHYLTADGNRRDGIGAIKLSGYK